MLKASVGLSHFVDVYVLYVYLGHCSCCRSHIFSINEDVHGVITAPLHTHTVPNLITHILILLFSAVFPSVKNVET